MKGFYLCCAFALLVIPLVLARTPALEITALQRYSKSVDLLRELSKEKHYESEAERNLIRSTRVNLTHKTERLLAEEIELKALKEKLNVLKNGSLFWWINPDRRQLVYEAQIEVNDQQRIVEDLMDDIEHLWKRVKPHYGIFSAMFGRELMEVFPNLLIALNESPQSPVAFEWVLVFLALFAYGGSQLFGIGAFVPGALFLFCSGVYFLLRLPFIMIQYNPNFVEFLLVYGGITSALVSAVIFVNQNFFKPEGKYYFNPAKISKTTATISSKRYE